MAMARHNRPSIMVYGGSIGESLDSKRDRNVKHVKAPGYSELLRKPINISTCFEAQGAYAYNTLKQPNDGGETSRTKDEILTDIEQHACPGAGACGGMYTANTLATAIESMGLTLPGSSSTPATSPSKMRECEKIGPAIKTCLEKNIRPSDLLTKRSFENALVMTMVRFLSVHLVCFQWLLPCDFVFGRLPIFNNYPHFYTGVFALKFILHEATVYSPKLMLTTPTSTS